MVPLGIRFGLGGILAVATLVLLVPWEAGAQTCQPRSDEMYYAVDCDSGSSPTKGIQEAIDACGAGYETQGCVVVLPRDEVVLQQTIQVGDPKEGITLRGHGAGSITNPTNISDAGTTLVWNAAGGTVLRVGAGRQIRLQDFTIWGDQDNDGASVADTLLKIQAGSNPVSGLIIENVDFQGSRGATVKPVGIRVTGDASKLHAQLDRIVLRNSSMNHVSTCYWQSSNQALLNLIQQFNCAQYQEHGVLVDGGSVSVVESVFTSQQDSGAIAAIRYHAPAGPPTRLTPIYQNVDRCHFEVGSGSAIVTSRETGGAMQQTHLRITGSHFVLQYPDSSPNDPSQDPELISIIDKGEVLIEGNSFGWTGDLQQMQGSGADIAVGGSLPSNVTALANHNRNLTNLDWVISGSVELYCPYADANGAFDDRDCDGVRDPGEPYLSGTSGSSFQGPARWAESAPGSESGDEVCADVGLACSQVVQLQHQQDPAFSACANLQPTASTFLALCY